jgi:hypothetical protein
VRRSLALPQLPEHRRWRVPRAKPSMWKFPSKSGPVFASDSIPGPFGTTGAVQTDDLWRGLGGFSAANARRRRELGQSHSSKSRVSGPRRAS